MCRVVIRYDTIQWRQDRGDVDAYTDDDNNDDDDGLYRVSSLYSTFWAANYKFLNTKQPGLLNRSYPELLFTLRADVVN